MFRAVSAVFCLLWFSAAPAHAQFHGGGPRLAVAKIGEDGRVVVTSSQMLAEFRQGSVTKTVMAREERQRIVERDGEQVTETYVVDVPQTVEETITFSVMKPVLTTTASEPAAVAAATMDGKPVPAAELARRLADATTVVLTAGPPVPEYHKLVLKPETLVLTIAPQASVAPPPPGAAPQPTSQPAAAAEIGGPAPETVFVSFGKDGTFDVRRFSEYSSMQTMTTGGEQPKQFIVSVTNRTSSITLLPAASVEISTAGGKTIEVEALRKSLTKEGAAVASADGKPVDPIWLTALKVDTLVIDGPEVVNPGPGPQGGYGAGYAPPAAPQPVPRPAQPPAAAPPVGEAPAAPMTRLESSPDERGVVDATNAERKKAGLKLLAVDPLLARAARGHAEAMAKANELNHTLAGKTMDHRLAAVGFEFTRAGENVAQGARTPAEAVSDWMASPGHKANILTAEYERIGVGVATSAGGERFWCQVFGSPWEGPMGAAVPVTGR